MATSIAISAPDSAKEGDTVSVSVVVTNVGAYPNTFKTEIYAVPDLYPDYLIGGGERTLFPGDWKLYSASFTMPDCNTTVFVSVEHLSAGEWVYDNSDSKVVSLEVVPPPPRPPACSISIDAPASAEEGDTVGVIATITNNSEDAQRYKTEIYAVPDNYPSYLIGSFDESIAGGSSKAYSASFTMPDCNTTILVWVELRWEGEWDYDNSDSEVVSLEILEPEFQGFEISEYITV